jgi:hypothetical protein
MGKNACQLLCNYLISVSTEPHPATQEQFNYPIQLLVLLAGPSSLVLRASDHAWEGNDDKIRAGVYAGTERVDAHINCTVIISPRWSDEG